MAIYPDYNASTPVDAAVARLTTFGAGIIALGAVFPDRRPEG